MKNYKGLLMLLIFFAGCEPEKKTEEPQVKVEDKPAVPELEYTLGATMPHDTTSFTEGLLFYNGVLFESTGSPSGSNFKSVLGTVDLKTGKINVKAELDKIYFGEGIAILKDKIYQVTYENQAGFIYNGKTFKKEGQFSYTNKQGWGMTTDGTFIIMSDGTEVLTYFDADFRPVKTVSVKENGYAMENLNELEFINGFIYANVWMTGDIVKIDPSDGTVVGRLNLAPVSYDIKNFHPSALEMNGIAYNAADDKIFITGKAWPKLYEIRFKH